MGEFRPAPRFSFMTLPEEALILSFKAFNAKETTGQILKFLGSPPTRLLISTRMEPFPLELEGSLLCADPFVGSFFVAKFFLLACGLFSVEFERCLPALLQKKYVIS